MSCIQNESFIIYIKFFLSLTLRCSIGLGQILIQILMKKLGIRISLSVSGPSLSSAVEASIKPLIFHHKQNHHYLSTTSSVSYKPFCLKAIQFKSHSENLENKKGLSMTKTNFKKFAASRIVSWGFSVNLENSYTSKWLLTSIFLVC